MINDWIPFFTELSGKLLAYRNNRQELISLIKTIFDETGIDMPRLDSDGLPIDIDPFTFYGLFCKNIKQESHDKILGAISKLMGIQQPVPTDMTLPTVNPLNATFYHFKHDPLYDPTEAERLWTLYENAILFADKGTKYEQAFITAFDDVRLIKGNRWKLTMGLFWIRPYFYANLDTVSRVYLDMHPDVPEKIRNEVKAMKGSLPSGRDFVEFCRDMKEFTEGNSNEGSIAAFSSNAFQASELKKLEEQYPGVSDEYIPSLTEYDPELTEEQWLDILDHFDKQDLTLKTLKALYLCGGEASIHVLHDAVTNDSGHFLSYANISACIADIGAAAHKKYGVAYWQGANEKGNDKDNTVAAQRRYIKENGKKTLSWRLRDELVAALHGFDMSDISVAVTPDLSGYWPSQEEYPLILTKEEWKAFIEKVEHPNHKGCMRMLKALMELGGQASLRKLSTTYGESQNFYLASAMNTGKRAQKYFELAPCISDGVEHFSAIPYLTKRVSEKGISTTSYRLRPTLLEALKEIDLSDIDISKEVDDDMVTYDKNQILYGPPGTGKTYHTVIYAVAIIEGKSTDEISSEPYVEVLDRFNGYKAKGLICSTTFHQSYGYEEFIEGISPVLDENEDSGLKYVIRDGVFKEFCEHASRPVIVKADDAVDPLINKYPRIWKVSLGGTYENEVRRDCLEQGRIRIGWDTYGSELDKVSEYTEGGKGILNAFYERMQIGDIIFSCYTNRLIDAIGVVTGDGEWDDSCSQYKRFRKVKWLVKDIREDIVDINEGKTMTLSAVYQLNVSLGDALAIVQKYSQESKVVQENKDRYVFIIDEINRGNISKIFGELITLIEDKKRGGAEEAMSVILPYSGKSFFVPDNVYLLGTMNTADRSIALMDTALRRRFSFVEMMPASKVLRDNGADMVGEIDVAKILDVMNERITYLFDREHTIGHAFFMPLADDPTIERLAAIFKKSVIPLLQEYFYEDYRKIQLVLGDTGKIDGLKFIRDIDVDAGKLFKGDTYELSDLPEQRFEINEAAFLNPESYKQII